LIVSRWLPTSRGHGAVLGLLRFLRVAYDFAVGRRGHRFAGAETALGMTETRLPHRPRSIARVAAPARPFDIGLPAESALKRAFYADCGIGRGNAPLAHRASAHGHRPAGAAIVVWGGMIGWCDCACR